MKSQVQQVSRRKTAASPSLKGLMYVNIKAVQFHKGKAWRKCRWLDLQDLVRTASPKNPINFRERNTSSFCLSTNLPLHCTSEQQHPFPVNLQKQAELPGVVSRSTAAQSAEPATCLSSRQIPRDCTRGLQPTNMQTTGSPLQPLTPELYIPPPDPAGTGSNQAAREKRALIRVNLELTH